MDVSILKFLCFLQNGFYEVHCNSNLCADYTQYIAPNILVTIIYDYRLERVGHPAARLHTCL
jgi:hypothetical protein